VEGKGPKWRSVVSTLYSRLFVFYLKRKDLKYKSSQFYLLFCRDMELDSSPNSEKWTEGDKEKGVEYNT
jgi:pyruvate dehydrogenase complex dehydrogenase (E1) component